MAIANAQAPVGNFSIAAGTTVAKAYTSNVTAGNLLVASCGWGSATQTCSVSGSLNGAFTAIATSLQTNATAALRCQIFFKIATASGSETITMTTSGSNSDRELVIYELTGANSTQPDAGGGGTGNSTNPTGSVTTVAAPGRIIAYAMSVAGTITAGSGFTSDKAQNGCLGESIAYAATGANSVATINASSSQWVIGAASFNEAGGGGGPVADKKLSVLGVG